MPKLEHIDLDVVEEKRERSVGRVKAHKRACAQATEEQKTAKKNGLFGLQAEGFTRERRSQKIREFTGAHLIDCCSKAGLAEAFINTSTRMQGVAELYEHAEKLYEENAPAPQAGAAFDAADGEFHQRRRLRTSRTRYKPTTALRPRTTRSSSPSGPAA